VEFGEDFMSTGVNLPFTYFFYVEASVLLKNVVTMVLRFSPTAKDVSLSPCNAKGERRYLIVANHS
jgi:hypothetical protein